MRFSTSTIGGLCALFLLESRALALPSLSRRLLPTPSNPDFPDPNDDSFYDIPNDVGSHSAGEILDSREVPTTINDSYYDKSYQILYRTQNTAKEADATVATLWTPKKASSPAKLFSWQVFEDSTQLDCNPSWAFIQNSSSQNTITTSVDAPVYIQWALEQGYYVVAPDHLGSSSAFIGGFQEGYAILDGIRAAISFNKLEKNVPTALAGYSGGGHATAWAANLHGSYAPELNIVGAVHGGTPVDTRGERTYRESFSSEFFIRNLQLSQRWTFLWFRRRRPCRTFTCVRGAERLYSIYCDRSRKS